MIHKVHFGKRIASYRKQQAWSQAELAERLGVTSQAVSKWRPGSSIIKDINTHASQTLAKHHLWRVHKMEKQIFDETNGLWYELKDGYYYPCLTTPEESDLPINVWGRQHERYLKEHRHIVYNSLLLSGKLNACLADIDRQAQEQYELLINQMKRSRGIAEDLKATDPLTWVRRMNNAQACAREIVNNEIIYS